MTSHGVDALFSALLQAATPERARRSPGTPGSACNRVRQQKSPRALILQGFWHFPGRLRIPWEQQLGGASLTRWELHYPQVRR